MAVGPSQAEASLRAGSEALLRAAWADARLQFEAALACGDAPDALLGLGIAARGQFDAEAAFAAHERGYRLARAQADARAAARFAFELVFDCLRFRGPAEAGGWLERGARLLAGVPEGREHALLAYLRARFALVAEHDPDRAAALAADGARLAREAGFADGELGCLALEGLASVAGGRVEEGMRLLDEAAAGAVAGEIADPQIVGSVCCHLIDACQRVRDFDRAGEWCRRVEAIAARFGDAGLFATCRTLYGEVLRLAGRVGRGRAHTRGRLPRHGRRPSQGRRWARVARGAAPPPGPARRRLGAAGAGRRARAGAGRAGGARARPRGGARGRGRGRAVPAPDRRSRPVPAGARARARGRGRRSRSAATDAAERAAAELESDRGADADRAAAGRGAARPRPGRGRSCAGCRPCGARGCGRPLPRERPRLRGRPGRARPGRRLAVGRTGGGGGRGRGRRTGRAWPARCRGRPVRCLGTTATR